MVRKNDNYIKENEIKSIIQVIFHQGFPQKKEGLSFFGFFMLIITITNIQIISL
jgi:hypothetical protein